MKLNIYQGPRTTTELNFRERVFLGQSRDLKNTCSLIYLGDFFNSPELISKLHDERIYDLQMVHSTGGQIPEINGEKQMQRSDRQIKYYKNISLHEMYEKPFNINSCNVEIVWSISSVSRRKNLLQQRDL